MPWLLWVPTADLAADVEASVAALWPDAAVEIRIGASDDPALYWDGDVLSWDHGEAHNEAVTGPSADAAVLLARSWLREEPATPTIGWVPRPPAPELEAIEPIEAIEEIAEVRKPRAPGSAYVALGVGSTFRLPGALNSYRMQVGGTSGRFWGGAVLSIADGTPAGKAPEWALAELEGRSDWVVYPVQGTALSVQAALETWRIRTGTWTTTPVAQAGFALRRVELRQLSDPGIPAVPFRDHLDVGPEVGVAVQTVGPTIGLRAGGLLSVGFVADARAYASLTGDVLVKL